MVGLHSDHASRLTAITLLMVVLAGCGLIDEEPYEAVYFVESYQVAGQPMQPIRLSRTAPVTAIFDTLGLAVRGARISVDLMGPSGIERHYAFVESGEPGVYVAETPEPVVPLRRYRLSIDAAGDAISAETLVPGAFEIVSVNADTVVYRAGVQVEFVLTRSAYPSRQAVFVFTSEALILDPDRLTPNAKEWQEEGDIYLEEMRLTTAPPLNEANYSVNPDGTLSVPMPWLMVSFYGLQRVSANAIDDNLWDFVRSHQVQQGGSTLAPGEIPNVIDHIEGGTGIFGSYAHVERDVYIAAPDEGL